MASRVGLGLATRLGFLVIPQQLEEFRRRGMGSVQIEMRRKRNPNPNPKDVGGLTSTPCQIRRLGPHDGLREVALGHRRRSPVTGRLRPA
jgi:hypothetical protein